MLKSLFSVCQQEQMATFRPVPFKFAGRFFAKGPFHLLPPYLSRQWYVQVRGRQSIRNSCHLYTVGSSNESEESKRESGREKSEADTLLTGRIRPRGHGNPVSLNLEHEENEMCM